MPERQQPAPKNGSKEIKEDKLKEEEDISDEEEADLEEADSDEEEVESDEEEVNESEDDEVLSGVEDEEESSDEECQVPEPKVKSGMGLVFQYIIHVYARIHFSSVYVDILQVSTLPFSGRKYISTCVHSPRTAH